MPGHGRNERHKVRVDRDAHKNIQSMSMVMTGEEDEETLLVKSD